MNDIPASIAKLLTHFVKEDRNGPGMTAEEIVQKLMRTFADVEEENLSRLTHLFLREHYNRYPAFDKKKTLFKVKLRFDLEAAKNITPSHSEWTKEVSFLQHFHTGSTLVFQRQAMGVPYFHTALLFKGNDGDMAVMELDGSYFPHRPFLMKMSDPADVFSRGSSDLFLKVDNREMTHRINIQDVLYKFARIADVPVHYHAMNLNCDVIRNWLLRGELEWTIATDESRGHGGLASSLSLGQTGLEGPDLLAIQFKLNSRDQ